MKRIVYLFIALLVISNVLYAQNIQVYPTNWWVGMKWNKVQLLVKGTQENFNTSQIRVSYTGVTVTKVHPLENGKYLAIDVSIAPTAKPGDVKFAFIQSKNIQTVTWQLKPRRKGVYAQGVNSSDLVYLLMPDRFSNGDASNDKIVGMRDQSLNRDSIYHRHGGDFQGIIQHLDYLQNIGVTTLWMTPVLENDQPNRTEHGYSFTNHYAIEPRFGGATWYEKLSDELHKRHMKLMQDAVYNHVGSKNIQFLDQPTKDWYHQWPTYTGTSFRDQPIFDPHGSKADSKITVDGWFTPEMPDLKQSNPYVANFLIQHALWCVEAFGVDGWRIDTYIYNDLPFMNKCNNALTNEYPHLTLFGETWVQGTANQAYFVQNNINTAFKSNLQGATDFQTLFHGILPTLKENIGWSDGVMKLYSTLSNDFLYKNANYNCIFLDNHDLTRIATEVGGDVAKVKMGIGWLLTCRGIPQLYYGTEVLMKGDKNPYDGNVRHDFPGGWAGDSKNAFTQAGLSSDEKMIQDYTKTLANFRKTASALQTGKLMQYVPKDGLYVYFRYNANQTIMCIMNTSDKEHSVDFANFTERTNGFTTATEVTDGNKYNKNFTIPAKKMWVLELGK